MSLQMMTMMAYAQADKKTLEDITNKSIELYNNEDYEASLQLLDKIKDSRDKYIIWYYYYGLNEMNLNQNDEALQNFNTYIKKANVQDTAKAYYNTGVIWFSKGEYEKAISSLQLSLDVSNDTELDSRTEKMIDKAVKHQSYFENSQKTNLSFLLGYNYDTNVVNLAPDSFSQNLNGHVISYGASLSHKVIDRYSFIFEPNVVILDSYTLDKSFKSDSTLQSADALQFLVSTPIRFYFEEGVYPTKFDFSFNGYAIYLPLTTTKRELALSSFFVKGGATSPVNEKYTLKYNAVLAVDKSYSHTVDEDDASGLRVEFDVALLNYMSKRNADNLFFDLGVEFDSAKGTNARYKKYSTDVGYAFGSFMQTESSIKLSYYYLNYPDKATSARTDNQVGATYTMNKVFAGGSALGFMLGAVSNSSNVDLYKYNDVLAGVQYSKSFGF